MRSFIALATLPLALSAPVIYTRDNNVGTEKYIVVMKPGSTLSAEHASKPNGLLKGIAPTIHYNTGNFKGFAASLSVDQVAALDSHAGVSNFCCFPL
jgi:hypothetical protein